MRSSLMVGFVMVVAACAADPFEASNASTPEAYVRSDSFDRLVIELDGVTGRGPREGVTDRLTTGLTPLLDKPGGIDIVRDEDLPASGADRVWSFDELDRLARDHQNADVEANEATFLTLWLDGEYEESSVLGVAWANRYLVIFADRIEAGCQRRLPALQEALCSEAEVAIWTHEVGHVIGLVNNGIPMAVDHEDVDHPRHTSDEDGIMYWAYEGANLFTLLEARGEDEGDLGFGAASQNDLAAFRQR